MKKYYTLLCIFLLCTLTSFDTSKACEYAGSNIGYVKSQTQKAIDAEDINLSRFFAYKALNAIEKSKKQFEDCGCDYAVKGIYEAKDNLKNATKIASLYGTKMLLEKALENTMGSLESLEEHEELHESRYASDVLAVNTMESEKIKLLMKGPVGKELERKIDSSLINYQNSLNNMVETLDCKVTYAYARKVYEHCEQQLLKPDLTEAKKYYNLRTKEITASALEELGDCE